MFTRLFPFHFWPSKLIEVILSLWLISAKFDEDAHNDSASIFVYASKSLLRRITLSGPAETGSNNPHYRSGEGGFGGIHSMD